MRESSLRISLYVYFSSKARPLAARSSPESAFGMHVGEDPHFEVCFTCNCRLLIRAPPRLRGLSPEANSLRDRSAGKQLYIISRPPLSVAEIIIYHTRFDTSPQARQNRNVLYNIRRKESKKLKIILAGRSRNEFVPSGRSENIGFQFGIKTVQ